MLVITSCSDTTDTSTEQQPLILTVEVEPLIASESYNYKSRFVGRVEANRSSRLGFDLGGELQQVMVTEGDVVKREQPLAKLNIDRLNAIENQAIAQLKQVETQLTLASSTLKRTKKAYQFEGVSIQQLEQAQQKFDNSQAAVASAKANLQRIKLDIWQSTLNAPYDAVIVKRYADEGEIMSPTQPVFDIEELGQRKVRIGASTDVSAQFNEGEVYKLSIGNKSMQAILKTILPTLNPITKTVDMLFILDESKTTIDTGSLAVLEYEKAIGTAGFWVPVSILTEGNRGLWTLLIAVTDNEGGYVLEQRTVAIVHQQGEQVFVKGPLTDGDLVVSGGVHRVVAGQRVNILQ